jgi:hypothetical protein
LPKEVPNHKVNRLHYGLNTILELVFVLASVLQQHLDKKASASGYY